MNIPSHLAISTIKLYQLLISPLLHTLSPSSGCRFRPTCSQLTITSIMKYGLFRGLKIGLSQFARCHPFSQI